MKTPEQMAKEYCDQFSWNDPREEDARDAFLAGYAAAQQKWISVNERLPEEDVAVLVYGQILNDPPDIIGVRRRYNGDQEWKHTWESEDGFIYREDDVTHWMPLPWMLLPEPPKENE